MAGTGRCHRCRAVEAVNELWPLVARAALVHALTMHANELRKAGPPDQALEAFEAALTQAGHGPRAGPVLPLLARAAAEAGDHARFHAAVQAADETTTAQTRPASGRHLIPLCAKHTRVLWTVRFPRPRIVDLR